MGETEKIYGKYWKDEEWWIEFFARYDKRVDECKEKAGHTFKWHNTSIGGFAQCPNCGVMNDEVKEEDCIEYVASEILEAKTKEKKAEDLKIRREATIAHLKSKGLPYWE